MRRFFFFPVLIACTVLFSCKSKKNIADSSIASSPSGDVQYDAYRNKLPNTQIARSEKSIKVTFDSEILFPTNSSYLTEKAKTDIKDLVEVIKQQGAVKIAIEGHSDKTGTPEYNKWLSEKRAASVKAMLVSLGLAESSVSTSGYGDTMPIADNRTPEGRAKNRRVELTITPAE